MLKDKIITKLCFIISDSWRRYSVDNSKGDFSFDFVNLFAI